MSSQASVSKWPKRLPELTPEQSRVREDFVKHWHDVLPQRYGVVEKFNHGYAAKFAAPGKRTLEIGAGLGEHLEFEPPRAPGDYVCNELREHMATEIRRRHPEVEVVVGDCQEGLPFPEASFDRVMAIHVLEHLPNLPAAIRELRRLVKPDGRLIAVIPCEGGMAYTLGRRISAQRIFEKRYKMSYDWFVSCEHINLPDEITAECEREFKLAGRAFFPLRVPSVSLNLAIGLEYAPRSS